jgi:hypothetical protein
VILRIERRQRTAADRRKEKNTYCTRQRHTQPRQGDSFQARRAHLLLLRNYCGVKGHLRRIEAARRTVDRPFAFVSTCCSVIREYLASSAFAWKGGRGATGACIDWCPADQVDGSDRKYLFVTFNRPSKTLVNPGGRLPPKRSNLRKIEKARRDGTWDVSVTGLSHPTNDVTTSFREETA